MNVRRMRQRMVRSRLAAAVLRSARLSLFAAETRMRRSLAVDKYCRGEGIEVGAAASPAIVPLGASVRYVDKYPYDVITADPELAELDAVRPDIVTSGDKLDGVADASQAFVLAFSLLEHVQDPVGALAAFVRVVRPGGAVIVSVPDKRYYAPDRERPLTTFEHLLRDHREGPEGSRLEHFREAARLARKLTGAEADAFVARLERNDGHCHFHVWDGTSFLECVQATIRTLALPAEIVEYAQYGHEVLCVLRRVDGAAA